MTEKEREDLYNIATHKPWLASLHLKEYLKTASVEELAYSPDSKSRHDAGSSPAAGTKKRTGDQNAALHLWFEQVAQTLNDAGYGIQTILKESAELSWTKENVKEILWKSIQRPLLKKASTTELSKTKEIDLIYDHLVRFLGEKFGIEVPPFPHDPDKGNVRLQAMENLHKEDYPSHSKTAFDEEDTTS